MIQINLLPHHLRPIKRTPLPHILAILVLIAAIAGMGYLYVAQVAQMAAARERKADIERQLAELQDVIEETERLAAQKLRLQSKVETIREILADRVIWSKQLYRLTELTPENIWYENVSVSQQRVPERHQKVDPQGKPVFDPKTGEPVMETRNVYKPIFMVSGYAVRDVAGDPNVNKFAEQTASDPAFNALFQLQDTRMRDTEYEGYQTRFFSFQYLIQNEGASS
jgi:hypothetical protein